MADPLLDRYQKTLASYRVRAAVGLVAVWNRLDSYDEADIETMERRSAALLASAKTAAVITSSAFFALRLEIPPVGVNPATIPVTPNLRVPFAATWHALTMGRPFEEAVAVGRSVSEATGFDFVQSAARRTGDRVAEAAGRPVRWRRVPGGKACPWCFDKAARTYRSAEAADFGHERCDCAAVPT